MKPALTHGGLAVLALLCAATQAEEPQPYKEPPGPWSDAAKPVTPRAPAAGEIPIDQPGCYAQEGAKYILSKDISSPMTPLFLGKDVVLDLNGHTVTFAAGGYQHIPNYGFEDGLAHWDVSKAPGAKAVSTIVRPLVGKEFCLLPAGQEIVSEAISLPVANRSYYATCVLSRARGWEGRKISLYVEDEKGGQIRCEFKGGSKPRVEGRIENQEAELGGGTIFTHLFYLPAGKYRLRVKAAAGDCEIDECDIRPALDAGIAVVGGVAPYATYADVTKWYPCFFFDYTKKDTAQPADTVPVAKGAGTVTIRNGTVKSGYEQGVRSWGIQCTAKDVRLVLENVRVLNSGLNANAVQAEIAEIRDCRFEVDTPFIINRHDTSEMSLKLGKAIEIAKSAFIGGQGNLSCGGGGANIHDNLFVNGQTVTNHYSISPGKGDRIYRNRFEPQVGSGIYIGSQDVEVYDNVFVISSAPPNSEYRYSEYSTNAVRISDYNKGTCTNNKVYRNRIGITGREYPEFDRYLPMTYAFFISNGGGGNQVYENEITVESQGPKVRALAFFVSGSNQGGDIFRNKITANVTPVCMGGDYGPANAVKFYENTIIHAKGAQPFKPFQVAANAKGVEFSGNKFVDCEFGVEGGGQYVNK